jgi:hypothetical protein
MGSFIFVLAGFICATCSAQDSGTNSLLKLSATEVKGHVGTNAIVTGKIAEVNVAERLVRLNFERPYPDQVFTAVIFAANTNLFPQVEKLKGKTVAVTGKIAAYRDHPQIVLTATNQLSLIESGAPAEKPESK